MIVDARSLYLFANAIRSKLGGLRHLYPSSCRAKLRFSNVQQYRGRRGHVQRLFFRFRYSLGLSLGGRVFPFVRRLLGVYAQYTVVIFRMFDVLCRFVVDGRFFGFLPKGRRVFSTVCFPIA